MWKPVIFSVFLICGTCSASQKVFHEINNTTYICNPISNTTNQEYMILGDGHDSCECRDTHCTCCEYDLEKICISVGYVEVFNIPAKFSLNVTYNDKPVVNLMVDVTNPPCIKIPFTDDFLDLCIQIYNIDVTDNYVSLCIQLRGHFIFTKFGVHLGCMQVPKSNKSAQEYLMDNSNMTSPSSSGTNRLFSFYLIALSLFFVIH